MYLDERKKLWKKMGADLRKELQLPTLKVFMNCQQMENDQATIELYFWMDDLFSKIMDSKALEEFLKNSDFKEFKKEEKHIRFYFHEHSKETY